MACPSGRRSTPRKRVRRQLLRGFKSHRHRHGVLTKVGTFELRNPPWAAGPAASRGVSSLRWTLPSRPCRFVRPPRWPRLQLPGLEEGAAAEMVDAATYERELRRRDAILDAARVATERFLGGTAAWTDELPVVLGALGRAAEVSRVFLSANFEDDQGRPVQPADPRMGRRGRGPVSRTTRSCRPFPTRRPGSIAGAESWAPARSSPGSSARCPRQSAPCSARRACSRRSRSRCSSRARGGGSSASTTASGSGPGPRPSSRRCGLPPGSSELPSGWNGRRSGCGSANASTRRSSSSSLDGLVVASPQGAIFQASKAFNELAQAAVGDGRVDEWVVPEARPELSGYLAMPAAERPPSLRDRAAPHRRAPGPGGGPRDAHRLAGPAGAADRRARRHRAREGRGSRWSAGLRRWRRSPRRSWWTSRSRRRCAAWPASSSRRARGSRWRST